MELHFSKQRCTCLHPQVREIQNGEQTQEIKLSDGMPDVGRVLAAWGQPILRGKEWQSETISFSGGMMVWVLYAPEDGSAERCLEGWIPFQMKWELPEESPEGQMRIRCLTRFVDARSLSARKIAVRAGMGVLAEAYRQTERELYEPDKIPEDVQLLRTMYPVRMYQEMGEKSFLMDEDLTLPDSSPVPDKLVYYTIDPVVTDKKVLANKVVFRGDGKLHILYRSTEGQLYSWDFSIPFSQYAQLDGEHSTDAQADLLLMPTSVELELDDESHLRLKCSVTAQYLVSDKQMLKLTEDAYSPSRETQLQIQHLELPVVLDSRRETVYLEQTVPGEANVVTDVRFLPDFPRQRRGEAGVELTVSGTCQVLYYGEDGALQSGTARWENQQTLGADENSQISVQPILQEEPQAAAGAGAMTAKWELPLEVTAFADQSLPMVTGLELGEPRKLDPNRPSLILCRAGEQRLWDIAKASNATLDAIRQANDLAGEPAPNQILLIPIA